MIQGSIWCVSWVLCVLIITASLDAIPDPPAVDPCRVAAKAATAHDVAREPQRLSSLEIPPPPYLVRWIVTRHRFETPFLHAVALVRHAGDPSPPVFL